MRRVIVLVASIVVSAAQAQAVDPAPAKLSGWWTLNAQPRTIIDAFSIVLEGDRRAATIPGKLTWRGVNCGALDEPIQVSWNGSELRFTATFKPNANTQRPDGKCPADPGQLVLRRVGTSDKFEGEARPPGSSLVITMTASP